MKRVFLVLLAAAWAACPLFSQSNVLLDEILAEQELTAESAAYLLLGVKGGEAEPLSRREALGRIRDRFSGMGDTISAGEFAFLLQNQLDLPRGLLSGFFPGPRYALRDLKFLRIIQERAHPDTPISGERAMRILGRALAEREDRS